MYKTNLPPSTGDYFSPTFTLKSSGIYKHVSLVGTDFQNVDRNSCCHNNIKFLVCYKMPCFDGKSSESGKLNTSTLNLFGIFIRSDRPSDDNFKNKIQKII